jgi:hypothetical protein
MKTFHSATQIFALCFALLIASGCSATAAAPTVVPPAAVALAVTASLLPPTDTPVPPTYTPSPTETLVPPTDTPVPPTDTPPPPTETPLPATETPTVPPTQTPAATATSTPPATGTATRVPPTRVPPTNPPLAQLHWTAHPVPVNLACRVHNEVDIFNQYSTPMTFSVAGFTYTFGHYPPTVQAICLNPGTYTWTASVEGFAQATGTIALGGNARSYWFTFGP